ncbi:MAG: DUF3011 domain-containing protein [Pseudomonadota bacterium]|nr:DUF3011 domain-containing protein [Pseudomonadota bacterium]
MIKNILYLTLVLVGFSLPGQALADISEDENSLLNHYDVTCESYNYNYYECALPGYVLDAWIIREYSHNACIPNHAWGISGNVVWVSRGCQATFRVQIQDRRPPRPPPRRVVDLRCESRDYGYHECYVGRRVVQLSLLQQMSKNECLYGQSWGFSNDAVWVDRGCRGLFRALIDP